MATKDGLGEEYNHLYKSIFFILNSKKKNKAFFKIKINIYIFII